MKVKNLRQYFPIKREVFRRTVGYVRAVDDVSFHIDDQETLGLVGESGCGKTTMGRTILHLLEPTGGEAFFMGEEIGVKLRHDPRDVRQKMQIIFQDPYGSLNPRMTVNEIVGEAVKNLP